MFTLGGRGVFTGVVLTLLAARLEGQTERWTLRTLAGPEGGLGSTDGPGAAARFNTLFGIGADGAGNVYVADHQNSTIRRVAPNGDVTTVIGVPGEYEGRDGTRLTGRLAAAMDVAADQAGNVWISQNGSYLRRVAPSGALTTIGGGAGGPIAVHDASGDVYVASDYCIRRYVPATEEYEPFAGECTGQSLGLVTALAVAQSGELYVGDNGGRLFHVSAGVGTIVASAAPDVLQGIAISDDGRVFYATRSSVFEVGIGRIAGDPPTNCSHHEPLDHADGLLARFHEVQDLAWRPDGTLVVAEVRGQLRTIDVDTGSVTTLSGRSAPAGLTDGTSLAARFSEPAAVAIAADGTMYIADSGNHRIRRIDTDGDVTTFSGGAPGPYCHGGGYGDGPADQANFLAPSGVALDGDGYLYVADTGNACIRRVAPDGSVSTLAGLCTAWNTSGQWTDGVGADARFVRPNGITIDQSGVLWVADSGLLRRVTREGQVTTPPGTIPARSVAAGPSGSIIVASTNTVHRYSGGTLTQLATDLSHPRVAVDELGNVYFTDQATQGVYRLNGTTPERILGPPPVPSIGGLNGAEDGTAAVARLYNPHQMTFGPDGRLYIADTGNNKIRVATLAAADTATIDVADGAPGQQRQLSAVPQTATAWSWSVSMRPAGSIASLSSTTSQSPTFTPDTPGRYRFRVHASNHSSESITETELRVCGPLAAVDVAVTSGQTTFCPLQNEPTLSATLSEGGLATIQWAYRTAPGAAVTPIAGRTGATYDLQSTDFPASGTYYVVAVASPQNGCGGGQQVSNEIEITIYPPMVEISAPASVCPLSEGNTATVIVDGEGTTFSWSVSGGTITSSRNSTEVTFTAGAGEIVELFVSASNGFCTTTRVATIAVKEAPALSPSSVNIADTGGSGTISVSGAPGCTWTASTTSAFVTIAGEGVGAGLGSVNFSVAPNTGDARAATITVGGTPFLITQAAVAPPVVTATATSATSVAVSWTGSGAATQFTVERSVENGLYTSVATVAARSFSDSGLQPGRTYLYRVRAVSAGSGSWSQPDHATTTMFTNDPLVPGTPVRAAHFTQLRSAIDAVRASAGLAAQSWTDPDLAGLRVRAVHLSQMRSALAEALAGLGRSTSFTNPTLTGVPIRAVHVQEIRQLVK